jgi:ribosomal protein S18 acetylase RimI-like enzyme
VLRVSAVQEVTEEVVTAVHRLLPQLSASARLPSGAEIDQIVTSQATTLLVARDDDLGEVDSDDEGDWTPADERADGPIVGMLTLVTFRIPTGVRAWIEDVVVDNAVGRRGVGTALTRAAVELANARGARTVDLTSRPAREAANHMYQKAGFQLRETMVYRYPLEPGSYGS